MTDLPSWAQAQGPHGSVAERAVIKARSQIIRSQAFYGALALNMKIVEDGAVKGVTVDGENITYNPEWVTGVTEPELQGAIALGVTKIALMHHVRRNGRDDETWQKASDLACVPMLKRALFTMPAGVTEDTSHDGETVEQIFNFLWAEKKKEEGQGQGQPGQGQGQPGQGQGQGQPGQPGQGQGQGQGQPGQPGKGQGQGQPGQPGQSPSAGQTGSALGPVTVADAPNPQQAEQIARVMTLQAAQAAKAMGDGRADCESLARQLSGAQLPWEVLLRDFMEKAAKADYSWQRPNRRFMARGMYLPTAHSLEMGELVIIIDTSGSLKDSELEDFGKECLAICEDLKPSKIWAVYVDTKVQRVDEFEEMEDFKLSAKGRGGTKLSAGIEWLGLGLADPAAVVFFTDMDNTSWGKDPGVPVLWVATGSPRRHKVPPYGDVVKYNEGLAV